MAKKHSTNIHFDLDLWEWLKQESHRRRASISQIVRELVVREMDSSKSVLKDLERLKSKGPGIKL